MDNGAEPKKIDLNKETQSVEQFISEAPPEIREKITESMSLMMHMGGGSIVEETVLKKIDSEHITQYLGLSKAHMEQEYKERRDAKVLYFVLAILFVIALFGIIFLLREDHSDVMEKIVYTVGAFVLGGIGGYGYGSRNKRE